MVNSYCRKLDVLDSLSGINRYALTLHQKRSVAELFGDTAPNDNDDFYNDLLKVIKSEPPHNILIVPGHFNAPIDDDRHKTNRQVIGRNNYHEKNK